MLPTNPSIGSSWPRTLSIARSGSSLKSGVGRRPHLRLTYLAVVLDLYSRRVIGWAMGHHLTVDLAERALTLALSHRPPPRTGSCTTRIAAVSIPPELPASAQCARHHCEHEPHRQLLGNACVESFFVTLKCGLVYHSQYRTRDEARQNIVEYIEAFSNWLRRHSTLGYHSPAEFEARSTVT